MPERVSAEALLNDALDAIIFADAAGIIRFWNRRAEELFGYSAAEAIGSSLDIIVPEPSRAGGGTGPASRPQ